MRRTGGEGGQRGGRRRAASQLNGGGGWGRQSCSALHTPESTGSWMRLSWACKSSRLDTSYSGSVWCSRTGEGRRTQEKRHRGERGGRHSSRQEQLKDTVKGDSACWHISTLPCNGAYQSNCLGSQCACAAHVFSSSNNNRRGTSMFRHPVGPWLESSNENDLDT